MLAGLFKALPFFCGMIRSEIKDRIGHVQLSRPEKRNAFNPELVGALKKEVAALNHNDEVRAILFTGEGEAFSAGADLGYLKELRANSLEENVSDSRSLADLFEMIYHSPKLTFSAVDGFALAGGCGLASITDFCYATNKAKFGFTEVRIGFIPAIVSVYLRYKISGSDINKLLLTGEIIDADKAFKMGLVSRILEFETFYERVFSEIKGITAMVSGQAIAQTKSLMRTSMAKQHDAAIETAVMFNAEARASDDCIRGVDSFLNKQKISW